MPPLGLVVTGFALVVLDLRFDGFDVAPDLVGWAVAAVGLLRLTGRSRWFWVGVATAVGGVLLGAPGLLEEPTGVLRTITTVLETAFVFSVCSGVAQAARSASGVRTTANLIRWIDLALVPTAVVLIPAVRGEPALVLVLALATLGVAAWFMIFLLSVRDHPTLQPVGGKGTERRR